MGGRGTAMRIVTVCMISVASGAELAAPVREGRWLRPASASNAAPIWGFAHGISIGLWPTQGPRGLIRVYSPYLDQQYPRMVNFVAIEPFVSGVRGFSEMERGRDGRQGLSIRSASTAAAAAEAWDADEMPAPDRGVVGDGDGAGSLTVFLAPEAFDNGARPIVQVAFRADRPREIGFRTFASPDSARMEACVLTATMGNYGRLRRLWLADEVVRAEDLWPQATSAMTGFLRHRSWTAEKMLRIGDDLLVAATSDESDPASATYAEDVAPWWRYRGRTATHFWRAPYRPEIRVRTNGRTTFWGSTAPIPGGAAFENFELVVPFTEGAESWFGITEEPPASLGFDTRPEREPSDR